MQLTRWRHHLPFVFPLTVMGALMAIERSEQIIDYRLLLVLVANLLAMSAAFIINDIEDANDDILDPDRRDHVIVGRTLDAETAMAAFRLMAFTALMLYAFCGRWLLFWGGLGLIMAYLYSTRPYRLKSRPVVDIISHGMGGGALQVAIGYYLYDQRPGTAWTIIVAMMMGSIYGQFYNQIDDYSTDQRAGITNTTQALGKSAANVLMYGAITLAGVLIIVAIMSGAFPRWLGTMIVIGGLSCSMFVWKHDMRGNKAGFLEGFQIPVLLVLNMTVMCWLAWAMGWFVPGGV